MRSKNIVMTVLISVIFLMIGLAAGSKMDKSPGTIPPSAIPTSTAPMTDAPDNTNIIVDGPEANQTVGKKFSVTGRARVFENVFQVRVMHDATGTALYFQPAYANAPDTGQYGSFGVQVNLPQRTPQNIEVKEGDRITLEVFQFSAKDGSEVDKVIIPLTI